MALHTQRHFYDRSPIWAKKFHRTCVMTALWLRQRCGLCRSHLKIKRLWWSLDEAFLPASLPPLWDRDGTPAKMQRRGIGKRVERCQRTVLRGQQAPENRCRTQGRKKRRSGGRSSRRTSG